MLMYSHINSVFCRHRTRRELMGIIVVVVAIVSLSGQRLRIIRALLDAGVASIEVGSFVSPQAVPAMAGVANG